MIVDLYLPCIPVEVTIYPSDPNKLTDLEAATLYYIRYLTSHGKAQATQVAEFLGLSDSIFNDMLIRMINRGWVSFVPGQGGLCVSSKACEYMDSVASADGGTASIPLRSSEEGKGVSVCYDPIGGEFVVIDQRFLSRRQGHERALPPSARKEARAMQPYGLALDPFDTSAQADADDSVENRILSALHADSRIKKNLLGSLGGTVPFIKPILARRPPVFDDLLYYQCRFEVRQGRGSEALYGAEGTSDLPELPPPVLICVEQKNPGIRRVGEKLCELIVHHAVEAANLPAADTGFLRMLHKRAEGSPAVREAVPDALLALRRQVSEILADSKVEVPDPEALVNLWDDVESRVVLISASRVDLAESKVVLPEQHARVAVELLGSAQRHVLVSSPRAQIDSRHLKSQLSALEALSTLHQKGSAGILVHLAKGTTRTGQPISDPVAITRLATALTPEKVDASDISQDHLATPFLHVDARDLLWQSGPLFGTTPVSGLHLRLAQAGSASSLWRLPQVLTPDLGARIGSFYKVAEADAKLAGSPPPEDVAHCCADVQSLLDTLLALESDDKKDRKDIAGDLDKQLGFLDDWIETQSDSLEPVVGSAISNSLLGLFSAEHDRASLVVGLAGRNDARGFDDLIELTSQRLQRQERERVAHRGTTRICLPADPGWDAAAQQFRKNFPVNAPGLSLVRISCPRLAGCTSFVMTENTAVFAKDGLVNYVPTAGRKVKGTQLGLYLRGKCLRNLAEAFIASEWPDAMPAQAEVRPDDQALRSRASSTVLIERVIQQAHHEGWFRDGNRGAERARLWLDRTRDATFGPARDPVKLARELLSSPEDRRRNCGYALAKALAQIEIEPSQQRIGGLTLFAADAEDVGDLVIASVFADDLPDHSFLRDPLSRELAYALGRRQEAVLSSAALQGILAPTQAAACLACLLMLEGLGGVLPAWLGDISETEDELPEVTLARTLAMFVTARGQVVFDLAHLTSAIETVPLTATLVAIGNLIASAQTREDTGLVPAVNRLRTSIFQNAENIIGALNTEVVRARDGLSESEVRARLRPVLERCKEELGIDVLASATLKSRKMSAKATATAFFDKANQAMHAKHGGVLVRVEKGGRNILRALTEIIDLVLHQLVPRYLGSASDNEMAVKQAIRRVQADVTTHSNALVDRLRRTLHERFGDLEACSPLQSEPWRFPRLLGKPDRPWDQRRVDILKMEFNPKSTFASAVEGIIALDRSEDPEALMILDELLQSVSDRVKHRDGAQKALKDRLEQIGDEHRSGLDAAERLALVLEGDPDPLKQACKAFRASLERLASSVDAGDIEVGILLVDELRTLAFPPLERTLDAAITHERALLQEEISTRCRGLSPHYFDEFLRSLADRRDAPTLLQLRQTIALAPSLAPPVMLKKSIWLDVGEGHMPQTDLREAGALMRIIASMRSTPTSGRRIEALTSEDCVNAIRSYFTIQPPEETLIRVESKGDLLRLRPLGQRFDAFAFDGDDGVEFIFPRARNAEDEFREASRSAARSGTAGGTNLFGRQAREPARVLLAIYRDDTLDGMSWLPWRSLASAASCKASERRILALGLVALQRFPLRQDLEHWWSNLEHRKRCTVVRRLLDLEEADSMAQHVPDDVLSAHLRNLCLALGHFSHKRNDLVELSPASVLAAAKAWLQLDRGALVERLVTLVSVMLGQNG